jgi:hypothetical protein
MPIIIVPYTESAFIQALAAGDTKALQEELKTTE